MKTWRDCTSLFLMEQKRKAAKFQLVFAIVIVCLACQTKCLDDYDFIIVGGGTAGLVVARRLAEGRKYYVLVLESGDLPKEGMDVPAYQSGFMDDLDIKFQYFSIPRPNLGLRNNGVVLGYSGRVLGGTSNLNHMSFNRGHPKDYDNWSNVTQDSSWNYANMLKFLKRVETYAGDFPSDHHGYSGPIMVSRPKYAPSLKEWLTAGKYLGYPIADPNGPQQVSFAPAEFSQRFGRRDSAFSGYIQPIWKNTPNLHIILNTNVTQVIFKGNRAVGVRFHSKSPELSGQSDNCIYARNEVIVSAGVYGSPLLLMRSGIGSKSMLRAANIPVVEDLPGVGQNYQNHIAVPLRVILNSRDAVVDHDQDLTPENWELFKKFGDGPFSSAIGASGQAFTVSSGAKLGSNSDWPDLQLVINANVQMYEIVDAMTGGNATVAPWEGPMIVNAHVGRPKSRGSLTLNPADPQGMPIFDSALLADAADVETALDGIKQLLQVFEKSPSFKKLGARLPPADIPSCRRFRYRSDNYWRCYIRYTATAGIHPVGTCAMGRGLGDAQAVVDTKLKVLGVSGLRVVDGSIMPTVTNANTQAAIYGIAEKASEMILEDWDRT